MPIRGKRPAGVISSARQALEAFDRMLDYQRRGDASRNRAMYYSAGTASQKMHWKRCDEYFSIASEWEDVLRQWIKSQDKQT